MPTNTSTGERPTGVIPHLNVAGGNAAIEFYIKAFGAKELMRVPAQDGKRLLHAELQINGALVYLHDDFPEMCGGKATTPKALGGTSVNLHMNVPNCDEAFNKAIAAGATSRMPPADMFWGDRYAVVIDPFGHEWAMAHALKK